MNLAAIDFGKKGVVVASSRRGGKTAALEDYLEKVRRFYPEAHVLIVKPVTTIEGKRST